MNAVNYINKNIILLTIKNVMKRTVLVQKLFIFGRSHLCIFLNGLL